MWRAWGGTAVLAAALVVAPVTSVTAPAAASTGASATVWAAQRAEQGATVAALRDRLVRLVNDRRRARDCRPLRQNADLNRAARTHTRRMANWDFDGRLDHQLPGEADPWTRIWQAGYHYGGAAENIVKSAATPAAAMEIWMGSTVHRRNMLNCRFRHIGVGLAYADSGTPYWTQDFGHR